MARDATYTVTIRGIRPLLMHNGQLADPLNDYAKELSRLTHKKQKSDEDHIAVGQAEFQGSLYHDDDVGPYIPVDNLQRMLEMGATNQKLGKKFKGVVEVLLPDEGPPGYRLEYKGPRERVALWDDKTFVFRKLVKVSQSKVVRTRPRFPSGWSVTFQVEVLRGGVTKENVEIALRDAGLYTGMGDWIPRYGRFEVVSVK